VCDICDALGQEVTEDGRIVRVGPYMGAEAVLEAFGRSARRTVRQATEREVFRHRREGWWGLDCHLCRYRVVGCATRLDAEFELLAHCYRDHRQP
jgi:hypothetical protein